MWETSDLLSAGLEEKLAPPKTVQQVPKQKTWQVEIKSRRGHSVTGSLFAARFGRSGILEEVKIHLSQDSIEDALDLETIKSISLPSLRRPLTAAGLFEYQIELGDPALMTIVVVGNK